jgi:hypothetical protein
VPVVVAVVLAICMPVEVLVVAVVALLVARLRLSLEQPTPAQVAEVPQTMLVAALVDQALSFSAIPTPTRSLLEPVLLAQQRPQVPIRSPRSRLVQTR